MDSGIATVEKADLQTFQSYLGNFWLFLQLDQETLNKHLLEEKNQANLVAFGTNYEVRFMIVHKEKEGNISIEL